MSIRSAIAGLRSIGIALAIGAGAFTWPVPASVLAAGTPSPPVAVEVCVAEQQSASNPNLKVGIGFRNDAAVAAAEVVFDILLVDQSNTVVDVQKKSIAGTFAPGVLVQPRRAAFTDTLLTQPEYPDSPAWNVANHYGSGAVRVRCVLDSATFSDGTAWHQSKT